MTATQLLSTIDFTKITAEQIGRCHKAFRGSVAYYLVESESTIDETTGYPVEYRVEYSKQYGFTCTCAAGQYGIHCKHIGWAIAASREEKEAFALIAREQAAQAAARKPLLIIGGKPADATTLNRVMNATPKPSHIKANSPKAFSILK